MAKGISIKIDGQWVTINENTEISIEMSSPVFNEQGTFSFPFELPYEENRHLLGSLGEVNGASRLYELNGKRFELYYEDILLFYGIVETDDEEEITNVIPVTLVSGNSMLKDLVEGMKANQVEVMNDIYLGYTVETLTMKTQSGGTRDIQYLDPEVFMNYEGVNVSYSYPTSKFCNVRVCYQPQNTDGNKINKYLTLDAKRPWSGVCFYLMYFFDCLFHQLGLAVSINQMMQYEDLKRLAFFTTKCEYKSEPSDRTFSINEPKTYVPDLLFHNKDKTASYYLRNANNIYATGRNFPDKDVLDIIASTRSAFGARFVVDTLQNKVNIYLIGDILRDTEIINLDVGSIASETVKHYRKSGVIVKYANSDKKDTSYYYNDYTKILEFRDYGKIIKSISEYDMNLYVDAISGKKFRVKVNKDAQTKEEWFPSLFEVGQFTQVKIGDVPDEDCEEIEIGFSPIVMNDVNAQKEKEGSNQQVLAAFLNVDMKEPETYPTKDTLKRVSTSYFTWTKQENYEPETSYSNSRSTSNRPIIGREPGGSSSNASGSSRPNYGRVPSGGRLLSANINSNLVTTRGDVTTDRVSSAVILWNYDNSSPLRSLESGLSIGIMRGPGNNAKKEILEYNYDGNGNDSWVFVPDNYAFDEDYITNWGQIYDYNGTEAGVPYVKEMFSLKLRAETSGLPIDSKYAKRGLVDKFLSEYTYFLSNHKSINIVTRMEISQLINIKWEKKYKIGQRIGYINNISYSISNKGISDVTIELFII